MILVRLIPRGEFITLPDHSAASVDYLMLAEQGPIIAAAVFVPAPPLIASWRRSKLRLMADRVSPLERSLLQDASLDASQRLIIKRKRLLSAAVFYFGCPGDSNLRTGETYRLCSGRSLERRDAISLPPSRTDILMFPTCPTPPPPPSTNMIKLKASISRPITPQTRRSLGSSMEPPPQKALIQSSN